MRVSSRIECASHSHWPPSSSQRPARQPADGERPMHGRAIFWGALDERLALGWEVVRQPFQLEAKERRFARFAGEARGSLERGWGSDAMSGEGPQKHNLAGCAIFRCASDSKG